MFVFVMLGISHSRKGIYVVALAWHSTWEFPLTFAPSRGAGTEALRRGVQCMLHTQGSPKSLVQNVSRTSLDEPATCNSQSRQLARGTVGEGASEAAGPLGVGVTVGGQHKALLLCPSLVLPLSLPAAGDPFLSVYLLPSENDLVGGNEGETIREAVQRLTWAIQAGAAGHGSNTETMASREASTVQDGWPGVAVAGHDGRAAGLHSLTQTAAWVDDPAGEGSVTTGWSPRSAGGTLCS